MEYAIYQLQEEKIHNLGFLSLKSYQNITKESDVLDMKNYDHVYQGEMENATLNKLYEVFNIAHPKDFQGHSMSVGDIIELEGKFYYCDSVGFAEINVVNVPTR